MIPTVAFPCCSIVFVQQSGLVDPCPTEICVQYVRCLQRKYASCTSVSMPPVLCARGSGARWRLDLQTERGRSVTLRFALSARDSATPTNSRGAVALLRSLGVRGEPQMRQIWSVPRVLTTCAIACPALGGSTVCQEVTCIPAVPASD